MVQPVISMHTFSSTLWAALQEDLHYGHHGFHLYASHSYADFTILNGPPNLYRKHPITKLDFNMLGLLT